jgi:uncharacterized protein (TIGR03435 family)
MRRELLLTTCVAIAACRLYAQAPASPPAFDVASVKPHPVGIGPGTAMRESTGAIDYTGVPLLNVIRRAYNVEPMQIVGPAWIATDTYDIHAKLPPATPLPQMQLMLQGLLAERFQLIVHREKKEFTGYTLVIGKQGSKMHPSENGRLGYGPTTKDAAGRHLRGKISMPILASYLSEELGRPVTDSTGLNGLFDISLDYSVDDAPAPGLFAAVQEQLGLKMEAKKALFEVIVVDRLGKVPTEN